MRYEDEWVSRTPIVRPPVGVQLLVPAAAEFLATEGDLEAIFSLGFVTSAAESAAVSTNATTLRRLVGCTRARMQGRHDKFDTWLSDLGARQLAFFVHPVGTTASPRNAFLLTYVTAESQQPSDN